MALFAIWHAEYGEAEAHAGLLQAAHVVPERVFAAAVETARGRWQLSAFACASHYYSAEAQVWIDPAEGACIIHGLIWRIDTGTLIDARAVAELLDRPGAALPDTIAGEFAIARLYPDGTLEAFSDPAGLHQIFHPTNGAPIVANRAAFA